MSSDDPLCACQTCAECPHGHTGEAFELCRGTSRFERGPARVVTRAVLTGEATPPELRNWTPDVRTPGGPADRQREDAAEARWCERNRCVHRSVEPIDVVGCRTCGGVTNLPAYRCEKLQRQCVDRRPPADPLIVHCGGCIFRDTPLRLSSRTDGITLITPTADRPELFALCERWMARQTIREQARPIQWIVAHNGRYSPQCTMGQELVAVDPAAIQPGKTTALGASLLAAIPLVRHHSVLIIEDDDWYGPEYVERMLALLDDHEIVGESHTLYYDLGLTGYVRMNNDTHASLCQTALKAGLLPQLAAACRQPKYSIDHLLWRKLPTGTRSRVVPPTGQSVGIKGGPGTPNYTLEVTRQRFPLTPDPGHSYLWSLIGSTDVSAYESVMTPTPPDGCIEWHDWAASQEGRALLDESRELLVIGKGPTFDRADHWCNQNPDGITMALNHALRSRPVDLAHVIDLEVLDEVPESVWWEHCRRIIVPWRPHCGFRPTHETIATTTHPLLGSLRDAGRLVWYNLSTAAVHGYTASPPGPEITCKTNSGEAVIRLLHSVGRSRCHTAGLDGGATYAPEFSELTPCRNGASFDAQQASLPTIGIAIQQVTTAADMCESARD